MILVKRATILKNSYIPGIDGLRAVAVLSVILFHLNSLILPGGFSGVDVFFVISGYVVSSSLAHDTHSKFLSFTIKFYARRIVRIFPALVACIVLVGLLQTLLVPASWLSTTSNKTAIFAFFGLSNFALIWFNEGYFSPRVEFNAFTHTWSLAVEEQFYLLFPLAFFVWLKWRERKDAVGIIANWLLVFLLCISFFYSWFETSASPDHAYYLLPSRFWELACGAMLFRMHKNNKIIASSEFTANGCIVAGLILIGLGLVFADPSYFPFPWAILPVSGTLLVIVGVASNFGRESKIALILSNKPVIYIGKLSYSLYLWHWPILVIFRWTVGLENPVAIFSALALMAIASVFSYHVIEKSIRQNVFLKSRSDWYVVSRGVGIICLSVIFLVVVFKQQPILSLSVTKDRHNWYPEVWPSYPGNRLPVSRAFEGRRVFVLGDSHTGAYSTMFGMLEEEQAVEVHQFTKGGCSIANLLNPSSNLECSQFIKQSVSEIKKIAAPGDVVFLASLRMNRLGDQWKMFDEVDVRRKQLSANSSAQRSFALQEADSLITSFEQASLTVVIDTPKPIFKSPPFRCSDLFNSSNSVCKGGLFMSRSVLSEYRKPVMESLVILTKKHKNLVVWDTFPVLCPLDRCSAFDGKMPLFFDGDHLSAHGNRVLYPSFLSMLKSVWLDKIPANQVAI